MKRMATAAQTPIGA